VDQHSQPVHVAMMKKQAPQHLCSNQPLDGHSDAGLNTTWQFVMASIMLTISWESFPDVVKNRSILKNGQKM